MSWNWSFFHSLCWALNVPFPYGNLCPSILINSYHCSIIFSHEIFFSEILINQILDFLKEASYFLFSLEFAVSAFRSIFWEVSSIFQLFTEFLISAIIFLFPSSFMNTISSLISQRTSIMIFEVFSSLLFPLFPLSLLS